MLASLEAAYNNFHNILSTAAILFCVAKRVRHYFFFHLAYAYTPKLVNAVVTETIRNTLESRVKRTDYELSVSVTTFPTLRS